MNFNYNILYYRPSLEFQNTLFHVLCSEEEVMSLSVFYHCICACLHCCYNFNPCSCHLLPYICILWSWYHVCHGFKVMSLVEILLMQHKIYIIIIIKNMKKLAFGQSVKNKMVNNSIRCLQMWPCCDCNLSQMCCYGPFIPHLPPPKKKNLQCTLMMMVMVWFWIYSTFYRKEWFPFYRWVDNDTDQLESAVASK